VQADAELLLVNANILRVKSTNSFAFTLKDHMNVGACHFYDPEEKNRTMNFDFKKTLRKASPDMAAI